MEQLDNQESVNIYIPKICPWCGNDLVYNAEYDWWECPNGDYIDC